VRGAIARALGLLFVATVATTAASFVPMISAAYTQLITTGKVISLMFPVAFAILWTMPVWLGCIAYALMWTIVPECRLRLPEIQQLPFTIRVGIIIAALFVLVAWGIYRIQFFGPVLDNVMMWLWSGSIAVLILFVLTIVIVDFGQYHRISRA
jgi:hypothetical protein